MKANVISVVWKICKFACMNKVLHDDFPFQFPYVECLIGPKLLFFNTVLDHRIHWITSSSDQTMKGKKFHTSYVHSCIFCSFACLVAMFLS